MIVPMTLTATPTPNTRQHAIAHAHHSFDSGEFRATLAKRVAVPTESQNPAQVATGLDDQPRFGQLRRSVSTASHRPTSDRLLAPSNSESATTHDADSPSCRVAMIFAVWAVAVAANGVDKPIVTGFLLSQITFKK